MAKIHLLNSAMMPAPGSYIMRAIDAGEFYERVAEAYYSKNLENYIGYPQNLEFIRQTTGIQLPESRETTRIDDGDQLLIMKLKYRANRPKGELIPAADFEFFHAKYQAT